MVNLKKHRYDNVLYIGHGDEYFVHKVRPVLYQIYLFVYDDVHAMEKETAREHKQYAKSFMQFFAAALMRVRVGAK
jgi:hypothetical protein